MFSTKAFQDVNRSLTTSCLYSVLAKSCFAPHHCGVLTFSGVRPRLLLLLLLVLLLLLLLLFLLLLLLLLTSPPPPPLHSPPHLFFFFFFLPHLISSFSPSLDHSLTHLWSGACLGMPGLGCYSPAHLGMPVLWGLLQGSRALGCRAWGLWGLLEAPCTLGCRACGACWRPRLGMPGLWPVRGPARLDRLGLWG